MKRIFSLLLALSLLLAATLCVVSCSEEPENNNETQCADYKITVVDGFGNPMANVIANFTDAEGNTKKSITGKDGVAKFKNVAVGENSVLLEKGFSDAAIVQ